MSETTHIAFQTPAENPTFRSSPNAVEGEASKPQFTPSKDEEAAFGASNENPNAFADVRTNVLEIDTKKKQEYHGLVLLWHDAEGRRVVYQSIGVIYGDIGTSPLYVYSSTFLSTPSHEDLLGAVSLIVWTLTLIVSVKYVVIVLRADDNGEGGTFALYTLLTRYSNIVEHDPKSARTLKIERHLSNHLRRPNRGFRSYLEKSSVAAWSLKILSILGVCLIMADGVLTPAQSILGAIQGLNVVKPDITVSQIVGISCAILIVLFLVQPFGTSKLGSSFAPIVIVWLMFNMTFGIYNLAKHDYTVLKAISPHYCFTYLVRNKEEGWKSLGGILLAFTGVETLYADLGAFSRRAISISWLYFAYPCLLLGYIGQAAYISTDPTGNAWSNPFFNTVPPGMFWPGLIVAILATIVASQATITATFQLLSQVMNMSYFPKIRLVHTSERFYGHIYIPMANWLLMIGTVVVTAVYSNTTKLGEAYGTCVVLVTFITTCMVSIAAIIVWRLHLLLVLAGFLFFACLDGLYLSSALTKVPNGAWFTLMLAAVLASIIITWRYGKETQWKAERSDRIPVSYLLSARDDGKVYLQDGVSKDEELAKVKGVGIFFDKEGDLSPAVYTQFLRKFQAAHQVTVFFHLRPILKPTVPSEDQFTISRETIPNCYRMIVRHGYNERIVSKDLANLIYDRLRHFITSGTDESVTFWPPGNGANGNIDPSREVEVLERAFGTQVLYAVGKEQLKIILPKGLSIKGFLRSVFLNAFIWMRDLTRSKIQEMDLPYDRLIEVAFVKEM